MRETRSSGSVEGVMGNHDSYSDSFEPVGYDAQRRTELDAKIGVGGTNDRLASLLHPVPRHHLRSVPYPPAGPFGSLIQRLSSSSEF